MSGTVDGLTGVNFTYSAMVPPETRYGVSIGSPAPDPGWRLFMRTKRSPAHGQSSPPLKRKGTWPVLMMSPS